MWWYKFNWNGETVRESTKQSNKRVAEQIEAAHRTSLAKGEVGIREKKRVPTLREFVEAEVVPFIQARSHDKANTLSYYQNGFKLLLAHDPLSSSPLDAVGSDKVAGYVAKLRKTGQSIATINRRLEVLRRVCKLAMEWGRVERALPKIQMLPGENHRERVLSAGEETSYFEGTHAIGVGIEKAYRGALLGIRATLRGEQPNRPTDPFLLRDVTALLMDCALRPDESFRLRWDQVRDDALHLPVGKTENARRTIPLTPRTSAYLAMRSSVAESEWVFPAGTKSGHIEKFSLKKQHTKACTLAEVPYFVLYTFRHTCLTRWASYMDPFTLAYLAGHSDFSTTRRYVHPQAHTVREAMERARTAQGGHNFGHSDQNAVESLNEAKDDNELILKGKLWSGREDSNLRPPGPEPGALPG